MSNPSEITTFAQLAFFRKMTVQVGGQIPAEAFDRIQDGYRNHLRWQLAHVWFVLERFVFHVGLRKYDQHDEHMALYGNGSSPENWQGVNVPSAAEWLERLAAQPDRIREALTGKLDEPLAEPFTFANGYTVTIPRELLNYGLFHEGMHLATMRTYLKNSQNK
jgi:hypothetical protein